MNIKQQLYKKCEVFIANRLQTVKSTINEIQESLTTETKSSAGDKHETGRAMLQLEREKVGNQLSEIQKTQEALTKIDITRTSNAVSLGSLVNTSKLNYFIAISAGKLNIEKETFYAISPSTPIGELLMGKTVGDLIRFRNQEFIIEKIG
ncbi:3-oxoacyl-ACP synthase [Seonamhaeicola sediminis]|uniref:3-oxoacyl-ACP synthase n=1 Tax=Seonamhaeicola sediminis TaxID=2528206 RepID=A0A562YBW4_9FLAO|nr:3-oxoacyl-ACP synthase [Seonamhaeicola sediminis]TWO31589.1 3-oxoacyl-ACP synthase [Seonamhaeicola sediminis]